MIAPRFSRRLHRYRGNYGRILREARKTLGLSAHYAASSLKISEAQLVAIEKGRAEVSASTWFNLCEFLWIDCDTALMGYNSYFHLLCVAGAIEREEYPHPVPNILAKSMVRVRKQEEIHHQRMMHHILHLTNS